MRPPAAVPTGAEAEAQSWATKFVTAHPDDFAFWRVDGERVVVPGVTAAAPTIFAKADKGRAAGVSLGTGTTSWTRQQQLRDDVLQFVTEKYPAAVSLDSRVDPVDGRIAVRVQKVPDGMLAALVSAFGADVITVEVAPDQAPAQAGG